MGQRGFASDNNSGIHPQILKAIREANSGHSVGYGDDPWTKEAIALFKNEFGEDTEVFMVLTGTGANILSIQSAVHSFHSIICSETAHIQTDECGAPEKFTGSKLIPVPTLDGKITPKQLEKYLHGFDSEHHSQPGLISITQVTELGTIIRYRKSGKLLSWPITMACICIWMEPEFPMLRYLLEFHSEPLPGMPVLISFHLGGQKME